MVESNALRFLISNVFTTQRYGGNPLAIVFGGDLLTAQQMQLMAAQFNLSETVFVLPPEDESNDHRLRIFTPQVELPFAGHPTVGTALALAEAADPAVAMLALEEGAGVIAVVIDESGEAPTATLTAAQPLTRAVETTRDQSAALLGLEAAHVVGEGIAASVGTPFLFVRVADEAALAAAAFSMEAWRAQGSADIRGHVFVYSIDGQDPARLHGRMFAPAFGIAEDPATGSAASTLAALLGEAAGDGTHEWLLQQGVQMGRPSRLRLGADVVDGSVTAARVGGSAVVIARGSIDPPES